jgi:hypothetical protein
MVGFEGREAQERKEGQMSLDIYTERGQVSLTQEGMLLCGFQSSFKDYYVVQTPKDEPSDIDGFLIKKGVIAAVFESKCRNATIAQMKNWGNEWLVTYDKLIRGIEVSKSLCVPFIGMLYLVDSEVGLSVRIADKYGNIIPKIRLERTETQKTINGGKIIRTNAYIDISLAKQFPVK